MHSTRLAQAFAKSHFLSHRIAIYFPPFILPCFHPRCWALRFPHTHAHSHSRASLIPSYLSRVIISQALPLPFASRPPPAARLDRAAGGQPRVSPINNLLSLLSQRTNFHDLLDDRPLWQRRAHVGGHGRAPSLSLSSGNPIAKLYPTSSSPDRAAPRSPRVSLSVRLVGPPRHRRDARVSVSHLAIRGPSWFDTSLRYELTRSRLVLWNRLRSRL